MSRATTPPAWYPDPGRAHEWRYFDGNAWTDAVSDAGVVTQAPLGAAPPGLVMWTQPEHMASEWRHSTAGPALPKVPRGKMWTFAILSAGVFWLHSPEHTIVIPFGALFAVLCWITTSQPLAAHRAAGSPAAKEMTAVRWVAVALTLFGFLQLTF